MNAGAPLNGMMSSGAPAGECCHEGPIPHGSDFKVSGHVDSLGAWPLKSQDFPWGTELWLVILSQGFPV